MRCWKVFETSKKSLSIAVSKRAARPPQLWSALLRARQMLRVVATSQSKEKYCYYVVHACGAQPSQTSCSAPQQYLSAVLPLNFFSDRLQKRPHPRGGSPTATRRVSSLGSALNQIRVSCPYKIRRRTPAVGPNAVYATGEMCVA